MHMHMLLPAASPQHHYTNETAEVHMVNCALGRVVKPMPKINTLRVTATSAVDVTICSIPKLAQTNNNHDNHIWSVDAA